MLLRPYFPFFFESSLLHSMPLMWYYMLCLIEIIAFCGVCSMHLQFFQACILTIFLFEVCCWRGITFYLLINSEIQLFLAEYARCISNFPAYADKYIRSYPIPCKYLGGPFKFVFGIPQVPPTTPPNVAGSTARSVIFTVFRFYEILLTFL